MKKNLVIEVIVFYMCIYNIYGVHFVKCYKLSVIQVFLGVEDTENHVLVLPFPLKVLVFDLSVSLLPPCLLHNPLFCLKGSFLQK